MRVPVVLNRPAVQVHQPVQVVAVHLVSVDPVNTTIMAVPAAAATTAAVAVITERAAVARPTRYRQLRELYTRVVIILQVQETALLLFPIMVTIRFTE
jgi:hypothetical protein